MVFCSLYRTRLTEYGVKKLLTETTCSTILLNKPFNTNYFSLFSRLQFLKVAKTSKLFNFIFV